MGAFRGFFTAPVWDHVLVLVAGVVLTPGKRTVSAALRIHGHDSAALDAPALGLAVLDHPGALAALR
jgi:hypothetical protein